MNELLASLGGAPIAIVAFLAAVGIVVFVHELGHYCAARASGIEVLVFSVGFGPPLVRWTDRSGTEWRVAILPVGGYVKFLDTQGSDTSAGLAGCPDFGRAAGKALPEASLSRRAFTVAAGPLANFIASAIVFAALALASGVVRDDVVIGSLKPLPADSSGLIAGDRIVAVNGEPVGSLTAFFDLAEGMSPEAETIYSVERDGRAGLVSGPHPLLPIIDSVRPASPAAKAGLRAGDLVLSAGGTQIRTFFELREIISASGGDQIELVVWRPDGSFSVSVGGKAQDIPLADGGFHRQVVIGVGGGTFFEPETVTPSIFEAAQTGAAQTAAVVSGTINGLVWMARGDISTCNIQGPIGIARITAGAAQQGLETFIRLIALLSTAIGFVNLLPIPGLDGGHLAFYLFEALAGRPPPKVFMRYMMALGLAMIALLMSFGILNDLTC